MSAIAHEHGDGHGHDDHGHHHKETFVTKYIFSQDHKMIAKQYLITGVLVMGFIGIAMSLLFRIVKSCAPVTRSLQALTDPYIRWQLVEGCFTI